MLEKNTQLFYCYCELIYTKKKKIIHFTRLPIQNETSETIVQNSSGLFPYIYDSLQLWTFFFPYLIIYLDIKWLFSRLKT